MTGLPTEPLGTDAEGHPYSQRYLDRYASRDGALGQARHVFLAGNGLPSRWAGRGQFVILETGFGLGVNFLATWQAWRDDPLRPQRLHFVSIEKHPVRAADIAAQAPAPLSDLAGRLAAAWPLPLSGLHRLAFEAGRITLTLCLGDAGTAARQLALGADAFYLDGFAPDRNPAMWQAPLLKALARLARPGASLASWSVARGVREALVAGGFDVALAQGYGAKREMLTARYAPRFRTRRREPPGPYEGERTAVVIGAGLAGCSTALALSRRGWDVTVLDPCAAAAGAASALPAGLLYPSLSLDDNPASRLMRAGFLYGRGLLDALPAGEAPMAATGVLKVDAQAGGDAGWNARLQDQHWPREFVQWCSAEEAQARVGSRPRHGGLWFAGGAVVDAGAWCRAMLAAGPAIRLATGRSATRLSPGADGRAERWSVHDASEQVLTAAVVVVAAALASPPLLGTACMPVRAIRGRISMLKAGSFGTLRAGLAGHGTLVPCLDGAAALGATYEAAASGDEAALSDAHAHRSNLDRLPGLLETPAEPDVVGLFDAVRCAARDRMPYAGAVADEAAALAAAQGLRGAHLEDLARRPGLYCLFALGSRGLALGPLLGERIAAQIEGEPEPIERSLGACVDPARYLLRRLRRGVG